MGTTMTVTTRITHKYLMGKTKWDLCQMIFMLMDQVEKAEEDAQRMTELAYTNQLQIDSLVQDNTDLQGQIDYLKRSMEDVRSYIREDRLGTARELLNLLIDGDNYDSLIPEGV